jgi:hypothetical protein
MRTYLLNSGLNMLSVQDSTNGPPLIFTGFTIGSEFNFVIDTLNPTIPGSPVFTGTTSNMKYIPTTVDEVIVQCFVPREQAPVTVGNIVLLANSTPFCVSIAQETWIKAQTTSSVVGSMYCYQLMLNIPQLQDRIAFANLTMNVAEFKHVTTENTLVTYPWEEVYDQVVIENHTRTGTPILVQNAWNDYWGSPLIQDITAANFGRIDGGE